jgi:hypothetical protein
MRIKKAIAPITLIILIYITSQTFLSSRQTLYELVDIDRPRVEFLKEKIMREKYDVNCKSLFEDDRTERFKALQLMARLKGNQSEIKLLNDSNFIFDSSQCGQFRNIRGYDRHKVSEFETKFPLAFTILVDENAEQLERLLRVIYRPQNIYCIHVDNKSSTALKAAIESIVNCFDNVFMPRETQKVYWAHFSLLRAQLNCMSDLLNLDNLINVEKHPRLENKRVIEWKYWLNLPSTFLPIRTNLELTRILSMYNGASEVHIIKDVSYNRKWKSRIETVHKLDSKGIVRSIKLPKSDPPFNFTVLTGWNYIAASRLFADYIINSKYGKNLTAWSADTFIPVRILQFSILLIHHILKTFFYLKSKG